MAIVAFEEQVEIPLNLRSLADFRRWVGSEAGPQRGRVDFIAGRIEVDMSPEDFFCHGTLKAEMVMVLNQLVKRGRLGHLVTDSTRVSSPSADLSTEPDVVFVSHEAIAEGRARLVPKGTGEPGRYTELEGAPDLVVEIVSDTSVTKDTRRLPEAYYRAAVPEFWLADARGERPEIQIHRRGPAAYEPVTADAGGFQLSAVLARCFRLDASRDDNGHWRFDLCDKGV